MLVHADPVGTAPGKRLANFKQVLESHPWMTERWLRRAVLESRFVYFKVDGILVFDLDEVDRYIESHRV
jgi:hypothetical protein